jgi:tetratricopeptide (TPR) repeat protein
MAGTDLRSVDGGRSRAALAGKRVTFAGRFAAVTREEAAELASEAGAIPGVGGDEDAAVLVVGEEGWPLDDDGRVPAELERAGRLREQGRPVELLGEHDFLARLGLPAGEVSGRLCTSEQLSRILHVPVRRLRAWIRRGLLKPVRSERRVDWFDFRQAAEIKRLAELTANGVSVATLRESLARIARWLPETESALARLSRWAGEAGLLVRVGEGKLAEPTGQLRLLFEEDPDALPTPLPAGDAPGSGGAASPGTGRPALTVIAGGARPAAALPAENAALGADEWFELALEYEEAERLDDAARAYREALLAGGPSAEIAFNLGNVLHSLGRWEEALSRFQQAVEADPDYPEAWNNLASVHAQFEEWDDAIEAGLRALEIAPDYPDAHYNLAEAYHAAGRRAEAIRHARAYLETDAKSPWARRLEQNLGLR